MTCGPPASSTHHEDINYHAIRCRSINCHAGMPWFAVQHQRGCSFVGCAVDVINGTFRIYEANSGERMVVDISPALHSPGGIDHLSILTFAFASSTGSNSSHCHLGADLVLVDVGNLSAVARRERKEGRLTQHFRSCRSQGIFSSAFYKYTSPTGFKEITDYRTCGAAFPA